MTNKNLDMHDLAAIYHDAKPDYRPDARTDNDELFRLKKAMNTLLPPEDLALFIIYAEVKSLRRMAEALNVSKSTMRNEIDRIRKRILDAL